MRFTRDGRGVRSIIWRWRAYVWRVRHAHFRAPSPAKVNGTRSIGFLMKRSYEQALVDTAFRGFMTNILQKDMSERTPKEIIQQAKEALQQQLDQCRSALDQLLQTWIGGNGASRFG